MAYWFLVSCHLLRRKHTDSPKPFYIDLFKIFKF